MKYIQGDLLDIKQGIIAHGCNLSGGFGSGVAGAIAKKYPLVKENYYENYKSKSLGEASGVEVVIGLYVINCFTQQRYGRDKSIQYADYNAIRDSLSKCIGLAQTIGVKEIHIPRIGCGLGGLNWELVENTLYNLEHTYNIEFVVCSL